MHWVTLGRATSLLRWTMAAVRRHHSLLSSVFQAVDSVRPLGSVFSVQPPILTTANISMTLTTSVQSQSAAIAAVTTAVGTFINTLPIGAPLPLTRLAQIAYDASSVVTNVGSLMINGSATDLVPGASGVIRVGSMSVS
jgi:Baseplate J-like protein